MMVLVGPPLSAKGPSWAAPWPTSPVPALRQVWLLPTLCPPSFQVPAGRSQLPLKMSAATEVTLVPPLSPLSMAPPSWLATLPDNVDAHKLSEPLPLSPLSMAPPSWLACCPKTLRPTR